MSNLSLTNKYRVMAAVHSDIMLELKRQNYVFQHAESLSDDVFELGKFIDGIEDPEEIEEYDPDMEYENQREKERELKQ